MGMIFEIISELIIVIFPIMLKFSLFIFLGTTHSKKMGRSDAINDNYGYYEKLGEKERRAIKTVVRVVLYSLSRHLTRRGIMRAKKLQFVLGYKVSGLGPGSYEPVVYVFNFPVFQSAFLVSVDFFFYLCF